jgi:3-ketosteroid 9alpha-monooxygenase subunit A
VATQFMQSRGRPDVGKGGQYAGEDNLLRSEASYFGPAYMINWLWNDFRGTTVETVLINTHYPIDKDAFVLQYGVKVKKLPGLDRDQATVIADKFARSFKIGFEQDVAIWQNKVRIENPLLCEEDGPVYQLRRWYEQFYVDAADVSDDMTARFEFEIDTTHAVAGWEKEVADNLRRRAEQEAAAAGS